MAGTLPSLDERTMQTLNDIKTLQTNEMQLYSSLNNDKLTPEERNQIMGQINQISQIRINLYDSIKTMYDNALLYASSTNDILVQQMTAINIIENELNESKKELDLIQSNKNNKQRLIQINTYYGKQYDYYKYIMQVVVFSCIPIIILTILGNNGFIPYFINNILISAIIIIAIIIIIYSIIDLSNRDNMNFDEYSYYNKDMPSSDTSNVGLTGTLDPWNLPSITCIGSQCCVPEVSVYDATTNKCVSISQQVTVTPK